MSDFASVQPFFEFLALLIGSAFLGWFAGVLVDLWYARREHHRFMKKVERMGKKHDSE